MDDLKQEGSANQMSAVVRGEVEAGHHVFAEDEFESEEPDTQVLLAAELAGNFGGQGSQSKEYSCYRNDGSNAENNA